MKFSILLLALVMFAASTALAQGVTFKYTPPTEGLTITTENAMTFSVTITADMGGEVNTMDMTNKTSATRDETILAVKDGKPAKSRIVWSAYQEEDSNPMGGGRGGRGGGGRQRPKPELNVAYIVDQPDSTLTVTREDGVAVSDEVRRFFTEEYMRSVVGDKIARFLDGKPVKLNEPMALDKELAASFMTSGRRNNIEPELKEFTLTLVGKAMEGNVNCAVFHLKMDAVAAQGPFSTQVKLDGDIMIDPARTWPVAMYLKGPVTMSSNNGAMNASGDGKMDGYKKWSYK
jgi:hypothetical protein